MTQPAKHIARAGFLLPGTISVGALARSGQAGSISFALGNRFRPAEDAHPRSKTDTGTLGQGFHAQFSRRCGYQISGPCVAVPPVKEAGDMATEKTPTDWEAIEREYRGGQLSVAEIGRKFGVSHTAIQKKAKKRNWARDLTERVKSEIAARMVAEGLQPAREAATIEHSVQRGVMILTGQRGRIGRTSEIVAKLLEELHDTTDNLAEIEDAIHDETEDDESGKRRARMLAAVALPSRSAVVNNLTQSLKTLIALERQAYNLGDAGDPDESASTRAVLDRLNGDQRKQLRAIALAASQRSDDDTSGA